MSRVFTFSMGLAILFLVAVEVYADQGTIVLTETTPDTIISAGATAKVYGTSGVNRATIESGAKAELINFPGSNAIIIQADSSLFTVFRSGATVTFEGTDGTVLKIPATGSLQTISFNDQTLTLNIDNNQVVLDDQVIGLSKAPIGQATSCTYSISPSSGSFTFIGETSSVSVTASTASCAWTATESLDWVSLSPTSGTGSESVTITADANTGAARNGSITIAGQTYTISQTGNSGYAISNSLGMTFVSISAGTFMMGSPEDEPGRDNETQHQVTLTQGYYMQTTEVTQGQWEEVMGSNPSYCNRCGSDCPVENVSWDDAQEFINKLNQKGEGTYMLPTEAQWEYVARAGSTTAFANGEITEPYGNDPNLDAMGWYWNNSSNTTHPVAQKTPNAWGLYDMHGNVWEWCQDWWGDYNSEAVTDPEGPLSGSYRVFRGGSWYFNAQFCRSALRSYDSPGNWYYDVGFRLVLSPGQQ